MSGRRRLDGRAALILILLEVGACVWLMVPRGEVASAGAGFGEYAASLAAGDGYRMPVPCGQLDAARRMPFHPAFLAAVARLGGGIWSAVWIKLALSMALLLAATTLLCRQHGRDPGRSTPWTGLWLLLAAMPMFAKHLAQINYEEGWAIVLVPCLLVVGLGVVGAAPAGAVSAASSSGGRRLAWSVACGVLAAGVFLLKSAYLPLHLCACGALAWAAVRERRALHWLGLGLALAAPMAWGAFVFARTGRFELGTSWDGENLYRGFCDACPHVYPWQSLDRLFDMPAVTTPGGSVQLPLLPPRCAFGSEWAWNDHYRDLARRWATGSPLAAAGYVAKKAAIILFEVRPVPLVGASDGLRAVPVIVSFVLARAALLLALVQGWRKRCSLARLRPSLLFATASLLALCAPLLLGFAYDRHTFVVLVAALFLAAGIATQARAEPA